MKWLIEPEIFQEDEQPLMDALEQLNVPHVSVKFGVPYSVYIETMGDTPTVFHGSLQLGKLIKSVPNHCIYVYCTLHKYECVYYYPRLGNYLLNSSYTMLPFGDLERRKKQLFGGALFLKPSSGYKTFTGLVLTNNTWDDEMHLLKNRIDPESLVVTAPAQRLKKEWRVVIIDDKVVTAGQYREDHVDVRKNTVHPDVLEFAQAVVDTTKFHPDRAWTLDICETVDGMLKVVEVNSFSCAGLYACDYTSIVKAIGNY